MKLKQSQNFFRQFVFICSFASNFCIATGIFKTVKQQTLRKFWGYRLIHIYHIIIKSNLSLYSLDYAEACNELAGPISASLRPGNTAPFEETSQRWRAVGNTVSDLTGPRFEPQTSRSRDERVTARPIIILINNQ